MRVCTNLFETDIANEPVIVMRKLPKPIFIFACFTFTGFGEGNFGGVFFRSTKLSGTSIARS